MQKAHSISKKDVQVTYALLNSRRNFDALSFCYDYYAVLWCSLWRRQLRELCEISSTGGAMTLTSLMTESVYESQRIRLEITDRAWILLNCRAR